MFPFQVVSVCVCTHMLDTRFAVNLIVQFSAKYRKLSLAFFLLATLTYHSAYNNTTTSQFD